LLIALSHARPVVFALGGKRISFVLAARVRDG